MQNAALLVGFLVLATAFVSWVNGRPARPSAAGPRTPDQRVADAWAGYGAADDLATMQSRVDPLLADLDVSALETRNAIVSLAVMAVRAERFDVLPDLAARARTLDGGCGETAALAVLAEACTGDPARARAMYAATQGAMAGCASCGTQGPGRFLLAEVSVMLEAASDAG